MVPPAERNDEPMQHRAGLEASYTTLLQAMAEPLTAMGNYLEAARALRRRDAPDFDAEFRDVLGKAQAELERATAVLNQMREVLRTAKP
jgi:signal transduction histidine kinase